ncbi:MAG: DUF3999 family protein, partial [Rubrivivax sp.]
ETVKRVRSGRQGAAPESVHPPVGAPASRLLRGAACWAPRWFAGVSTLIAIAACSVAPLALASGSARPSSDAGVDLGSRFAATAPLTLVPQEGLQRLALPLPVLQASRSPGWADARVLDGAGRPVPLAWLPRPAAPTAPDDPALNSTALPALAWPEPPSRQGAVGGAPAPGRGGGGSAGAGVPGSGCRAAGGHPGGVPDRH